MPWQFEAAGRKRHGRNHHPADATRLQDMCEPFAGQSWFREPEMFHPISEGSGLGKCTAIHPSEKRRLLPAIPLFKTRDIGKHIAFARGGTLMPVMVQRGQRGVRPVIERGSHPANPIPCRFWNRRMIAQGKRDRCRADVAACGDVAKGNSDTTHFTAKVTPPLTVSSPWYEKSTRSRFPT